MPYTSTEKRPPGRHLLHEQLAQLHALPHRQRAERRNSGLRSRHKIPSINQSLPIVCWLEDELDEALTIMPTSASDNLQEDLRERAALVREAHHGRRGGGRWYCQGPVLLDVVLHQCGSMCLTSESIVLRLTFNHELHVRHDSRPHRHLTSLYQRPRQ